VRSLDNLYQYELTYRWADGPLCGFILLNPSKLGGRLSAGEDDELPGGLGNTGQRCVNYAWAWGYAGMVVRNRFAFRSTDPADLMRVTDPYGPENERHLENARDDAITIAGWGGSQVVKTAPPLPEGIELHCLGTNADGSPRHPLHAPHDVRPRPWPVVEGGRHERHSAV